MPFKSAEAKAEYNRIYYQNRKLRINAEKIAKNLKMAELKKLSNRYYWYLGGPECEKKLLI